MYEALTIMSSRSESISYPISLQYAQGADNVMRNFNKAQQIKFMKVPVTPAKEYKQYRWQQNSQWMSPNPSACLIRGSLLNRLPSRQFFISRKLNKTLKNTEFQSTYVCNQSSALKDDALLENLRMVTEQTWFKAEQLIDVMQGKFLSFLVQTTRAVRVLEIGCFTGYSALCLANGLAPGGSLTTCDIDKNALEFAQKYFDQSSHANQITTVAQDGVVYLNSIPQHQHFDFIFIDANKRQYRTYYDTIMQRSLLHPSGLLVFDNTLFRGRVAAYASGLAVNKERIARRMAEFNAHIRVQFRYLRRYGMDLR
ncbi:hypothetical protein CCR75_007161 [Bremia lactucae]|uniref:Caffeoyl-CoA O-methyltransferase n=1 Tax=Bremia lactucae TaxID=4779 RepID=A0A976IA85_BRELC|nr:hypothetical protein CCR75_007161 [Bremia lactucae]